jgi:hypothetical protein
MHRTYTRPYVGKTRSGSFATFRSAVVPTEETHGNAYRYAIGPFRTARAARYMRDVCAIGGMVTTVSQAEKQARCVNAY